MTAGEYRTPPAACILPTFFIIGASKSGTTSLHFYLDAHPEIEMTARKEPHFMIGPGWEGRCSRYAELFRGDVAIRGDSSPGYAVFPKNADAAPNIRSKVPEARLIYCVRDPVDRCLAQYAQHLTIGQDNDPIEIAIRPHDPACEYVNASRYGSNFRHYLEHFAAEQILIIDQAELRERRRETLAAIFSHVGADASYWRDHFDREHNVRGADNMQLPGRLKGLRRGRLNEFSKRVMPTGVRSHVVSAIRQTIGREIRPQLPPELLRELEDALRPEAETFRRLSGRSFSAWSV